MLKKKNALLVLILFILITLFGCTKTNPSIVKIEGNVDYKSEMKIMMQGSEYGEKVLMLPIHLYYNREKNLYTVNTNSAHTVTTPEGKKFEFELKGLSDGFAKERNGNFDIEWTCTDSLGKTFSGKSISVDFEIEQVEKNSIKVKYAINGKKTDSLLVFESKSQ